MQWSTLFFVLAGVAAVLAVAATIWFFVVAIKAHLGFALGWLCCAVFGLVLLIQHWRDLKRPWAVRLMLIACVPVTLFAGTCWRDVESAEAFEREAQAAPP